MKSYFQPFLLVAAAVFLVQPPSAVAFEACLVSANGSYDPGSVSSLETELLQVAMNLEFLEAEFFLWSALGRGLDSIRPDLAWNGPGPKGAQRAILDAYTRNLTIQFGYQEVGHLRALRITMGYDSIPRPLLDLSRSTWASVFDKAFGFKLNPPFNVYYNSLHFLLGCYVIPYVGLTGYVGANPLLQTSTAKRLVAGLLGVESGQDAVIRAYLAEHADVILVPYTFTVGEVTARISILRSTLAHADGADDEGLQVPACQGAEGKAYNNVLVGDPYSVSYSRTPEQVLSIVYGTGSPSCPGGFFPNGGNGVVAKNYVSLGCTGL